MIERLIGDKRMAVMGSVPISRRRPLDDRDRPEEQETRNPGRTTTATLPLLAQLVVTPETSAIILARLPQPAHKPNLSTNLSWQKRWDFAGEVRERPKQPPEESDHSEFDGLMVKRPTSKSSTQRLAATLLAKSDSFKTGYEAESSYSRCES